MALFRPDFLDGNDAGEAGLVLEVLIGADDALEVVVGKKALGARLKAWESGCGESFSSVIKRVLPEPGTLGAFLGFTDINQTQVLAGNQGMEEAFEVLSAVKGDPWT